MTASHSTVRSTLADLSASEGVQFYREGWYTPDHSGKLWYLVRQGVDGEWTAFCYHEIGRASCRERVSSPV